jgi:hypothetical protein
LSPILGSKAVSPRDRSRSKGTPWRRAQDEKTAHRVNPAVLPHQLPVPRGSRRVAGRCRAQTRKWPKSSDSRALAAVACLSAELDVARRVRASSADRNDAVELQPLACTTQSTHRPLSRRQTSWRTRSGIASRLNSPACTAAPGPPASSRAAPPEARSGFNPRSPATAKTASNSLRIVAARPDPSFVTSSRRQTVGSEGRGAYAPADEEEKSRGSVGVLHRHHRRRIPASSATARARARRLPSCGSRCG